MKRNLTDAEDCILGFDELPRRIFIDTNILQYLQDFGEYIFDHYIDNENYFLSPKGNRIDKNNRLYWEIVALREILLGIDRTNVEFALSEVIHDEVANRLNNEFYLWFCEMWNYWQETAAGYAECPFSAESQVRYKTAYQDNALIKNLSRQDRSVVLDAIQLDCNALLTVDKFANINKQSFVYNKYKLRILTPSNLVQTLKPFQALWY